MLANLSGSTPNSSGTTPIKPAFGGSLLDGAGGLALEAPEEGGDEESRILLIGELCNFAILSFRANFLSNKHFRHLERLLKPIGRMERIRGDENKNHSTLDRRLRDRDGETGSLRSKF